MCGRQPDGVWGAPPQLASPKLSFLPQWNHQVTSYIPSAGAEIPLMTAPPLPRSNCDSFLPPEQHSIPSLIASRDGQGPALHVEIVVAPKSVLGGTASPPYQLGA